MAKVEVNVATLPTITRNFAEIGRVLDWAVEGADHGTHFNGESYEDGIIALWHWLIGISDEAPDQG